MENITQGSGQENINLVEAFEAVPRVELVEKVKGMLTPEEAKVLTKNDLDLIINIAHRYLEQKRSQTVEDALVVGTIARAEALKMLGENSIGAYVQNQKGEVLATGSDEADAVKKAQEMVRE